MAESDPKKLGAKALSQDGTATPDAGAVDLKKSRAIFLSGFGGLKHVKVKERDEVPPKQGEVAVRVKACGVNFLDLMTRQGLVENSAKTPFVMGCECAGVVEAVGEGVTDVQTGDRVLVFAEHGAWSEYILATVDYVHRIPAKMSFQEAAIMGFAALPAYIILHDVISAKSGDSVLVHSAGGGVGLMVGQLAKLMGGVQLIGTASKAKHDSIKEYFTNLIDHDQDYVAEVKKLYPGGVHAVMDCLSGEEINKGMSLLKPLGKYVLYGSSKFVTGESKSLFSVAKSWWQIDRISPMKLHEENKTMGGFSLKGLLFRQNQTAYVREVITKLFDYYNKGQLKVTVDSEWAFEDVCEAMQKLHDRKNIGKIVLDPAAQPKQKTAEPKAAEANEPNKETPKEQ